jgi:flagellar protein FlaJ
MLVLGLLFGLLVLVILPIGALYGTMGSAASKAKSRGKDIDLRIASAMSFISAMSSADVNVDVIVKELSRQKVYGAIREEAEWITRDAEFLGLDILSSLKRASLRTPSRKFQDFLQGVVTTSTSGGQLKPYFLVKAEQFEKENKLDMKKKMETLGLMAEMFVTVVVAFPLFLVVILAIMSLIGGGGMGVVMSIYVIVGVMVPAMQVMFIWLIRGMSQEV